LVGGRHAPHGRTGVFLKDSGRAPSVMGGFHMLKAEEALLP